MATQTEKRKRGKMCHFNQCCVIIDVRVKKLAYTDRWGDKKRKNKRMKMRKSQLKTVINVQITTLRMICLLSLYIMA